MPIFIHNSLTRKKEEFIPLNPPQVNMYTCGVTVYDESHIGHARSLYIFEVIRKYFEYRGFKVNFVRNITDIDDKIINRANELKVNWQELAEKYISRYYEDLELLGVRKADVEPRATQNIQEMIKAIASLVEKGFAYAAGGDVYFNVRKFSSYGKLSGQAIDAMEKGVRIEPSESKKDPLDFALWKKSKENEPAWKSPWGEGRPGWHIECSVMSQKFLNTQTLDIHAGGRDLIFPHHENEIAQAEALTGKPFAKYWLHHGLLTINGQKMSKSLGNFVTIKDFIAKYKDPDLLKLFFLSVHYSHPIDYTEEKLLVANQQKADFENFFRYVDSWKQFVDYWMTNPELANLKNRTKTPISAEDKEKIGKISNKFEQAMDDDFNTPQALGCLFELKDLGSKLVSLDKEEAFSYVESLIKKYFSIFGLTVVAMEKIPAEILRKLADIEVARIKKDFKRADIIRKELAETRNIAVMNTGSSIAITLSKLPKKE